MKTWQVLFKEDRAGRTSGGAQGESTSDTDDFDDAADDALVQEGEAELEDLDEEEEEPEAESEEEEEQSDEDQDDLDEEEEIDSEEEEESVSGFKFKNPKTGDFDFARINKAVGGPELEKAFKEQTATITRTSQENKALREQLEAPEMRERVQKGGFLDHLMANYPEVRDQVLQILHGGNPAQGQHQNRAGAFEIPGLNPDDPLAPVVQQLHATVQNLQNRQEQENRQREANERNANFEKGLRQARSRFKELIGRDATEEELTLVAKEMEASRYLNGASFVPGLFIDEIRKAEARKVLEARKVKRGLPKTGSGGRKPAPAKARRSKEDEQDELWEQHMSGGDDD